MQDISRRSPEHDEKLSLKRLEIVKQNAVMTSHLDKRNGFRWKVVIWTLIQNAPMEASWKQKWRIYVGYGQRDVTNALKHFLIGQFVKFFLLIGQSNVTKLCSEP